MDPSVQGKHSGSTKVSVRQDLTFGFQLLDSRFVSRKKKENLMSKDNENGVM